MAAWRASNRDRINETAKLWRVTNSDRVNSKRRSRRAENREHVNARARLWRMKNKSVMDQDQLKSERLKDTVKVGTWRAKNRLKANAAASRWRAKYMTVEISRFNSLARALSKHGLTIDEYHAIQEQQDFQCAICHADEPSKNKRFTRFHIDHCHASAAVRGLLCNNCNTAIGLLRDSPALCRNVADYLETR